MLALLLCAGCVVPGDGPFGPDPFADRLDPINATYGETPWTSVPTGVGNVLGGAAFAPLTLIAAPVDWLLLGRTEESPLVTGSVSSGAYLGGFVVGSPFVLIYWGGYGAWFE